MALTLGTNVGFVTTAPTADPNGTAVTSDGSSFVVKDTAPTGAVKITEIGWYKASGSTSSNFQVGLYANESNIAGTRLNVSSDAASGTTAGWKVISGLNWSITPGTSYWLGVQQDAHTGSSQIDSASSGGSGIDTRTSQTALTNPYGGGIVSDADGMYAIYALIQSIPSVTLSSPSDGGSTTDTTPDLTFSATDPQSDTVEYELQLSSSNSFGVTYVSKTNGTVQGGSSLTWSHTVASGNDRLLVVAVSIVKDPSPVPTVSSVTFGGTNLTQAGTKTDSSKTRTDIWYLVNPSVTTADIVVTCSASPDAFSGGASNWTGVKQTGGVGTFYSANNVSNTASVDVSSASGEVVMDCATTVDTLTVGANQTQIWNTNIFFTTSGGSYEAGASTTTMSWTLGGIQTWTIAAVPLKPSLILDSLSTDAAGDFQAGHPFNSGSSVTYTVQSALALGTYYWRVRAKDPSGSNTWGDWSSAWSFTINEAGATSIKDIICSGFIPFSR